MSVVSRLKSASIEITLNHYQNMLFHLNNILVSLKSITSIGLNWTNGNSVQNSGLVQEVLQVEL